MVRSLSLLCYSTKELPMKKFWNDDDGVVISAEIVLICTILVLGLIVGMTQFQTSIIAELQDLACAFGNFDQSYQTSGLISFSFKGISNAYSSNARTYGAVYFDRPDACDCNSAFLVCNDQGEQNVGTTCNNASPTTGYTPGFGGGFR